VLAFVNLALGRLAPRSWSRRGRSAVQEAGAPGAGRSRDPALGLVETHLLPGATPPRPKWSLHERTPRKRSHEFSGAPALFATPRGRGAVRPRAPLAGPPPDGSLRAGGVAIGPRHAGLQADP